MRRAEAMVLVMSVDSVYAKTLVLPVMPVSVVKQTARSLRMGKYVQVKHVC